MRLENPHAKRLVLIVEDNQQVRRVIAKALTLEGYVTQEANDGQKALKLINEIKPDLILSDINMPKMNGFEFYKQLRSSSQWAAIPFIFLTSSDSPALIQEGRELGVEDYIVKPIDYNQLAKIIGARLYRTAEVEAAHTENAYLETVKSLANAIEGRDRFARGHNNRVTFYALWVAKALKWPDHHLRVLKFGARLHDIGKIAISAKTLNKPKSLTKDEWALMKQHPVIGAKMIRGIHYLNSAVPYILYHHERWDGSGYPKGLAGKEIPIQGRLLAIVDSYDALTTKRSYHPPREHQEVVQFLRAKAGTYFDPDLTRIFIKIIERYHSQTSSQKAGNKKVSPI